MMRILNEYQVSDIKAIDANGDTTLHLVVKDEHLTAQKKIENLIMLLDSGLDLHSENQNEETILHLAIKYRAKDVIDFLLTGKVDLDNLAALYLIENEYRNLLELKNQSDDEMQMKESESASFVEWMITRGLDIDLPNRQGQSALLLALDYDLQHLLPVLLKYTKNIDYVCYETRRTLRHMALENKAMTRWPPSYSRRYATSVIKVLLDRGVSPESVDKSLNTALHLAIADLEDGNVVQLLIDHTTNFNHKNDAGETPFFIAFRKCLGLKKQSTVHDYLEICQSLIIKGADVNEGNNSGFRPLHIFAEKTSSRKCLDEEAIKLFKMLIHNGCNVNAKNSHGQTPLHIAAAGDNKSLVQMLIENDARINPRDDHGTTPLHLAVCNEAAAEIVEILIENGANVDATDYEGFTPLHKAAGEHKLFSYPFDATARLKLLLEHGADFCALSVEGYSVLLMSLHKYYNSSLKNDWFRNKSDPLSIDDIASCKFFDHEHHLNREVQFLLDHWIKLYAAGVECNIGFPFETERITDGLEYYPESRKIYGDCIEEIKILKNTFIDNNRTSIYAFVHMNLNIRRAHIHHEKLQQLVNSLSQLKKQFPQYAILILSSYNETIRRNWLMESAEIALMKFTKIYLTDLCSEKILGSLSYTELYDLIEASKIDYY